MSAKHTDIDQDSDLEATCRDLESNIRRALQRASEVPTSDKPVKLGGMLIDDPPPFTTVETWQSHLDYLKKLPECLERNWAIQHAEEHMAFLKKEGDPFNPNR
jgi:hypothetical protein